MDIVGGQGPLAEDSYIVVDDSDSDSDLMADILMGGNAIEVLDTPPPVDASAALERQHHHQRHQKRRQQPERAAAEGDARAGSLSCQNIPLLNCFFLYRCPIDAGRRPGSSLSWYLLPRWDVSSNPSTVTVCLFFLEKKKCPTSGERTNR